jgi:hypothetical protein
MNTDKELDGNLNAKGNVMRSLLELQSRLSDSISLRSSMIMPVLMLHGFTISSLKLRMFRWTGSHISPIRLPQDTFWTLWIGVSGAVFQFLIMSYNFG